MLPGSQSLEHATEQAVLRRALAAAHAAPDQDPFYCLALTYDLDADETSLLNCGVRLGLDRVRATLLDALRPRFVQLWDPHEFQVDMTVAYVGDASAELADLSEQLMDRYGEAGIEEVQRSVVIHAAQKLNDAISETSLSRTDDFVVYAVDFELELLADDLRNSIPGPRFRALEAKGWMAGLDRGSR